MPDAPQSPPPGAEYLTDEEIRRIDEEGAKKRDPRAERLKEIVKAAIASASAGHMDEVLAADEALRLELQARNVAAIVGPMITDKDRVDTARH